MSNTQTAKEAYDRVLVAMSQVRGEALYRARRVAPSPSQVNTEMTVGEEERILWSQLASKLECAIDSFINS